VVRTFAGLPGECDWVALREFVPSARATLAINDGALAGALDGRQVEVVTILPGFAPAVVRDDGAIWLGIQVGHQSGDPSRDVCAALEIAAGLDAGEQVTFDELPAPGQRLQDVVDLQSAFEPQVQEGFDFLFDGVDDTDGSIADNLEKLNESIAPTRRLQAVDAAYWVSTKSREHIRWVLPYDEEQALDALARVHAAGVDGVGADSRLVGSFRAHGLLVPVWDLPSGTGVDAVEEPMATMLERFGNALAVTGRLTDAERSARAGLANRQLTIR
jgi:hypothetical protein